MKINCTIMAVHISVAAAIVFAGNPPRPIEALVERGTGKVSVVKPAPAVWSAAETNNTHYLWCAVNNTNLLATLESVLSPGKSLTAVMANPFVLEQTNAAGRVTNRIETYRVHVAVAQTQMVEYGEIVDLSPLYYYGGSAN